MPPFLRSDTGTAPKFTRDASARAAPCGVSGCVVLLFFLCVRQAFPAKTSRLALGALALSSSCGVKLACFQNLLGAQA